MFKSILWILHFKMSKFYFGRQVGVTLAVRASIANFRTISSGEEWSVHLRSKFNASRPQIWFQHPSEFLCGPSEVWWGGGGVDASAFRVPRHVLKAALQRERRMHRSRDNKALRSERWVGTAQEQRVFPLAHLPKRCIWLRVWDWTL